MPVVTRIVRLLGRIPRKYRWTLLVGAFAVCWAIRTGSGQMAIGLAPVAAIEAVSSGMMTCAWVLRWLFSTPKGHRKLGELIPAALMLAGAFTIFPYGTHISLQGWMWTGFDAIVEVLVVDLRVAQSKAGIYEKGQLAAFAVGFLFFGPVLLFSHHDLWRLDVIGIAALNGLCFALGGVLYNYANGRLDKRTAKLLPGGNPVWSIAVAKGVLHQRITAFTVAALFPYLGAATIRAFHATNEAQKNQREIAA